MIQKFNQSLHGILLQDSEQQMILNARRSLVAKMTRHQPPQIDIFFLNINVRRSHLVNDSLNEVITLHKKLKSNSGTIIIHASNEISVIRVRPLVK